MDIISLGTDGSNAWFGLYNDVEEIALIQHIIMEDWSIKNPPEEAPQFLFSNDIITTQSTFEDPHVYDIMPLQPSVLAATNENIEGFYENQSYVELNNASYVAVQEFAVNQSSSSIQYNIEACQDQSSCNVNLNTFSCMKENGASEIQALDRKLLNRTPKTIDPVSSTTDLQCPELKIVIEPQKIYRFRYETEIGDPHGFLRGENKAIEFSPTMELRFAKNTDNISCYIRFTLVEKEKNYVMSSHKLQRLANKQKVPECESTLYPFEEISPKLFRFTMNKFIIINTKQDQCKQEIIKKIEKLQERRDVQSKYIPERPKQPQEKSQKSVEVYICCEAFVYTGTHYTSIAGPIFTQSITRGVPLKIVRICNIYGSLYRETEVSIVVSGIKSLDFKIRIAESLSPDEVDKPWERYIAVEKNMVELKCVITFQMPRYGGEQIKKNRNVKKIACTIQLERFNGDRSNAVDFNYFATLKRSQLLNDLFEDTAVSLSKRRNIDDNCDSPNVLKPDALGTIPLYQNKNIPHNIGTIYQDIRELYTNSLKEQNKIKYSQLVKSKLEDYTLNHPYGNSILHDIVQANNPDINEKFYKIMNYFELRDWVRDSKNDNGDTALMYACFFKNFYWIRPLINIQTPIEASDAEDGCNVLHIAFEISHTTCLEIIMKCIKEGMNAASFVAALKDRNFNGLTPLHVAVVNDDVKNVGELLEFCIKHNGEDAFECRQMSTGNTILHLAALNRSNAMYECILKHTSRRLVNILNYAGQTPDELMHSLESNQRRPSVDIPIQSLEI